MTPADKPKDELPWETVREHQLDNENGFFQDFAKVPIHEARELHAMKERVAKFEEAAKAILDAFSTASIIGSKDYDLIPPIINAAISHLRSAMKGTNK